MPRKPKTPQIRTTVLLETDEDIDRYIERNQLNNARIEAEQKRNADRATAARQTLASTDRGRRRLAEVDAIRAEGACPPASPLGAAISAAEREAEALCEKYLVEGVQGAGAAAMLTGSPADRAFHLTLPFLMDLQKLAKDARYALAAHHMTGREGQAPTGVTINDNNRNLLASVVCYATSRPGVRWVLDDATTFDQVAAELAEDVHCDLADMPFSRKLQQYKTIGKFDCVGEMAEQVARHRSQTDFYENELKIMAHRYRDSLKRPDSLFVGNLFPVAFGNEIVFLKMCIGHWLAMASKYEIQIRECDAEEPWEGPGNWW